jgi:DNA repair protein RecN (Recombination protein N)
MLKHLQIKNYALIQKLEMRPSGALNTITGETGAGKSIMLGAIGLLMGNRADTKVLFNEDTKCVIEGTFDLSEYELQTVFEEEDLDYEQTCIIRREISPSGKSRAFINDTPVKLPVLRRIGDFLMDIHSQHDTLQLGSNTYQLNIIDAYAGNKELLKAYQKEYRAYKKAERAYKELLEQADELRKEADYNHFLYNELAEAALEANEQHELEAELEVLENSEEIKTKLNTALGLISESETSVTSMLHDVHHTLKQLAGIAEKYEGVRSRAESCLIELKDIASEIESAEAEVIFDPERINVINDRLSLIYQLQQKHRVDTVEGLLTIQNKLEQEVNKVENLDEEIEMAREQVDKLHKVMMVKARELTASRLGVTASIEMEVTHLLKNLGMPNATMKIDHQEVEPTSTGIDEVNLLFSANKGVKPQELKNVASGGEFSRLMFCVKYILADKTALPTIIFDEIDTGISGEVAIQMVSMMQKMANSHQVIVITHLPQVAARGEAHYFVYKDNSTDRTISNIRLLEQEERISEIAKMIGGGNPSPIAFENAKELLNAS